MYNIKNFVNQFAIIWSHELVQKRELC